MVSDLPPDTYVADWDAVGTTAFSAAGLTPAEGHTIFAYVAIAVYDSVMAIEGGYEPFAVDLDAPEGASPEAAVAAAARAILVHYLPAQAGTVERGVHGIAATIEDGQARTTAWRRARRWRPSSSRCAPETASAPTSPTPHQTRRSPACGSPPGRCRSGRTSA